VCFSTQKVVGIERQILDVLSEFHVRPYEVKTFDLDMFTPAI